MASFGPLIHKYYMAGNNVYQLVTDRIIEQLEQGIIPWQRPTNRIRWF